MAGPPPTSTSDQDGAREQTEGETQAARCRQCGAGSHVIDTKETNRHIRRRRKCGACGWRWTTREYAE